MIYEDMERLHKMTAYFEGERLDAYLDSKGILTIGVGHNCQARPVPGVSKAGDCITADVSAVLFREDMGRAIAQTQTALPWVADMNQARQAVLYDMAFNMGIGKVGGGGLLSFNRPGGTLDAVKHGDYIYAAMRFKQSQWAKDVGPRRAEPLTRQLETGNWYELKG